MGFIWWIFALFFSKPPLVAGEPIADIIFSNQNRISINGTLFKLNKIANKPDYAMNDKASGTKLWKELIRITGLSEL